MVLYPFPSPDCSQDLLLKNHMCCIWWEKEISSTKCLLWNYGNWYYSLYHLTSSQLAAKDCRSWSIRSHNLLKVKKNFKKECKVECWFSVQQWSDHAISYSNWRTISLKLVKISWSSYDRKIPLAFCKNSYSKKLQFEMLNFKLIWKQNISTSNQSFVACWNITLHSRNIFPTAPFFKSVQIFKSVCHKFVTLSIGILTNKKIQEGCWKAS